MKILFCLILLLLSLQSVASDLTIGSVITSPVSGCNLTNSEIVRITVINADNSAYSGTFDVSYTTAGTTVTESINIPVLPVSATYIYEFSATVDLSNCGIHVIDLTVTDVNDLNTANNSISVSITNDCTPTSGNISGPTAVCETSNSGQIEILGNTGIITDWAFSEDNGATFTSTANTSSIETFTNITLERIYRIYFDSQFGLCPSDSIDYTVAIDQASNAGVLLGDSTHCDTILATTLNLSGYNGNVINYQLSLNGGTTYTTYINPFDTLEYTEFGNSFQFFAITQNGTCPSDSSNIVSIDITSGADAGNIVGNDTLCAGETTTDLDLVNFDGVILDWEYSQDNGATWISTGLNASTISLSNITTNAIVRAIVEKQPCGTDTTFMNIVILTPSNAGTIAGSTTFCDITNTGTISTAGSNGNVLGWISSTDSGATFNNINNTNNTLTYNNISQNTTYAIIVQVDGCLPDTSDFASISIISGTVPGNIVVADSICQTAQGIELSLINNEGVITGWEYSLDSGDTWVNTGSADTTINQPGIFGQVDFRVIVENVPCEADTAFASTFIYGPFDTFAFEDTINLGDSLSLQASNGESFIWSPNIYINNHLISNPKVSPPINTIYQVTVVDSNGCSSISSHSVVVIDIEPEEDIILEINNFISPNGDGFNDSWFIKDIELYPTNSVTVFNSYGQIIFSASPYLNNWNVEADDLPNGTYFYTVTIEPNQSPTKGTITIIDK